MRAGCGEPIVLLHGYMSKKESFYYQINCLKDYYTVIAPDFPAFGGSAPIERAWSVGDYCDWLVKFFKAQNLESAHILAHSFGARVAIKFAAAHPERVNKLIITGGAGVVCHDEKYHKKVRAYRRMKRFFPRLAEKRYGSEEYKKLSPLMRESYKKIVNEDLREEAAKILSPTLLIYGKGDTSTPPEKEGRIFASQIKNSRLEVVAGSHFCFCEHPDYFNGLVINFLRN